MIYVREIWQGEQRGVCTIEESESALEAALLMAEWHIGALVVMRDGQLRGIVTERDVMRRVMAEHRSPEGTSVGEIMSCPVQVCYLDDPVDTVRSTMCAYHIRHVPILDDGKVVGVIAMRDVLEATLRESREDLAKLQSYVYGPACGG